MTCIQTVNGECAAGIGTAVVVNEEGWIVTAAHILHQFATLSTAEGQTRALQTQIDLVHNDAALSAKDRRRKINALQRPKPTDITKWAAWVGIDGVSISPGFALDPVDLAVARLENFEGKLNISDYPVFKDPTKDYEPGTSLCRTGFPFADVRPIWDTSNNSFKLTQFVPLPLFPTEGILSRLRLNVLLDPTGTPLPPPPFLMAHIETSNAGILGQSGGPIFDQDGTIWGIQTETMSFPFDLKTKVQQYYHVGAGVHAGTIIGFFEANGIKYRKSDN